MLPIFESGLTAAGAPAFVTLRSETTLPQHYQMRERTERDYRGDTGASSAIRVVPLLTVRGVAGESVIAVGTIRVAVSGAQVVALEVFLQGLWAEGDEGAFVPIEVLSEGYETASRAVHDYLVEACPTSNDQEAPNNDYRAALVAKTLAEHSRNALASVREFRYTLELQLAETSARSSIHGSQSSVVSALLQLGIVCGRVSDCTREIVREGLWVWLNDSEAYHAYRLLQDPKIITSVAPATALTRPWMRLHDAGMRQCRELLRQLETESTSIRSLLGAATSVSSSREADAQAGFNTLAAVASLGLGVPALVLALYGADRLLPLDTLPRQFAFLPVAAGLIFAAVLAVQRSPKGKRRRIWLMWAGLTMTMMLGLLVVAGLIAPGA